MPKLWAIFALSNKNKEDLIMTYYNNDGNKFKVYYKWLDRSLYTYNSWAEAKKENYGKFLYIAALQYSRLTGGEEIIQVKGFRTKPKTTKQIKAFMQSITERMQKYPAIPFAEYKK